MQRPTPVPPKLLITVGGFTVAFVWWRVAMGEPQAAWHGWVVGVGTALMMVGIVLLGMRRR